MRRDIPYYFSYYIFEFLFFRIRAMSMFDRVSTRSALILKDFIAAQPFGSSRLTASHSGSTDPFSRIPL